MKRLSQRLSQIFLQIGRALEGYRELVLAWLNGVATHLFPTPVKVRATGSRPPRPRG